MIGNKVINAKVQNGKMLFRTGGGYITFAEFLKLYAREQVEELRQFAMSEDMSLEEVLGRFEQHYIEEYQKHQSKARPQFGSARETIGHNPFH